MTTEMMGETNEHVYMNNAELHKLILLNIKRSENQYEDFNLYVHPNISQKKLDILEKRLTEFIANNPKNFKNNLMLWGYEVVNSERMDLKITVQYTCNLHVGDIYKENRSKFLRALKRCIDETDIAIISNHI